MCPTQLQVVLG